jgi:hypothetical protein
MLKKILYYYGSFATHLMTSIPCSHGPDQWPKIAIPCCHVFRYMEVGGAATERVLDVPIYGANVSITSLNIRYAK